MVRARHRSLQKIEALLTDAGFSKADKEMWLEYLGGLPESVTEKELQKIIDDVPPPLEPKSPSYVRKQAILLYYDLLSWWTHRHPIIRLLYLLAWGNLLVVQVVKAGLSWYTLLSVVIIIGIRAAASWRELDPGHVKKFSINYNERKLLFRNLIETQQLWGVSSPPNKREIRAFQRDALKLLTLYVRDHRSDLKGRKIFANLLIRVGSNVVVIARSDDVRPVPQRYPKEKCTLVWEAIETGVPQMTGNLYSAFPTTVAGKPYNSVLAIPIRLGDKTLGCISIDSEAKYHFDRNFVELQTFVAPYVQLIATSLLGEYDLSVLTEGGKNDDAADP